MLCVTFDTDHMDEGRMVEFLAEVAIQGTATFFCTQNYNCLYSSRHEIAPHPALPEGVPWLPELKRMRRLFPKAQGWRSHSCVFSHLIAEWLAANGYRYASTNDQFGSKGITPARHPWGVWHMPIFYMDNMDFSSKCFWEDQATGAFSKTLIETALGDDGFYVFDFHPIHLLLNTPNRDWYFAMRDRFKAGETLRSLVYSGDGTRTFYDALSAAMRQRRIESFSLAEALDSYVGFTGGERFGVPPD